MLPKKIRESLTARIFLLTFLILVGACGMTFGLMAWATPITYTTVAYNELQKQAEALAGKLAETDFDACGAVIDAFIRSTGADVALMDAQGKAVSTSSQLASRIVYQDESFLVSTTVGADAIAEGWDLQIVADGQTAADLLSSAANSVAFDVTFADKAGPYTLCVTSYTQAKNQVVETMKQMAPWLLMVLLLFSLLCAFFLLALHRPPHRPHQRHR